MSSRAIVHRGRSAHGAGVASGPGRLEAGGRSADTPRRNCEVVVRIQVSVQHTGVEGLRYTFMVHVVRGGNWHEVGVGGEGGKDNE